MEKYIYIGNDFQLGNHFLRKNMVISKEDKESLVKVNEKVKNLFMTTKEYSDKKIDLNKKDSFIYKRVEKAFKEVINEI